MSMKRSKYKTFVQNGTVLMAAVCLAYVSSLTNHRVKEVRIPSSVGSVAAKHTSKLTLPLSVLIEKTSSDEIKPDTPFTLKGTVISNQDLDVLEIEWNVPKFFKVTGDRKIVVHNVKAQRPETVEISVVSTSAENQQIHLAAGATIGKTRFSNATSYNTVDQLVLEHEKEKLVQRAGNYQKAMKR